MAGSTPADLAVTFRSLDRRLREALEDQPPSDEVAPLVADLDAVAASAAQELGVPAAGDRRAQGEAIAAAIERIPADRWDGALLERLRAAALEAGRLLRAIAEATERRS